MSGNTLVRMKLCTAMFDKHDGIHSVWVSRQFG